MKNMGKILALILMLGFSSLVTVGPGGGQEKKAKQQNLSSEKEPGVLKASNLIGKNVKNPEGENLGEIKELVIDPEQARIAYAVVSFGGFLGMGDKLFAVPWKALRMDRDKDVLVLNVAKERLKKAPGFDKNNWPNLADRKYGSEIHSFYGEKPY